MKVVLPIALMVLGGAHAAWAGERVALVPYQALKVEADVVSRLDAALRAKLATTGRDVATDDRVQRAGAMCGEDVECLATIGTRAGAPWVFAWGVGRIGGAMLFTAMLIETATARRHGAFSEKTAASGDDVPALAGRAVDQLLRDAPRAPVEMPSLVAPQATVVQPTPLARPRPLRPWAIGAASAAGAATIATVVVGLSAQAAFTQLPLVAVEQRAPAVAHQQRLNTGADVALGLAVTAAATAVVLFVLDARPTAEATP